MLTNTEQLKLDGEFFVKEFLRTGDKRFKDKIVSCYAPLIKHVVGRFNLSHASTIDKDDLYQAGIFGLLKALERYRPENGVPFKSFAYKRIYGEVVDTLRKEGLMGRDKYEKVKNLENAIAVLCSQLQREPSVDEICDYLKIDEGEYHSILNASQMVYTTSLNSKIYDGEGEFIYRIDQIVDEEQLSPEDILINQNLRVNLKRIINTLPEREKIILALYFYEELTLADIGRVLNLSEARISQILSKTLLDIRTTLNR